MPGSDQTGLMGMGQMTGKKWSICDAARIPNNPYQRYGWGANFRFREGRRRHMSIFDFRNRYTMRHDHQTPYNFTSYNFTPTVQDEKNYLKKEAAFLKDSLSKIKENIKDIEISTDK